VDSLSRRSFCVGTTAVVAASVVTPVVALSTPTKTCVPKIDPRVASEMKRIKEQFTSYAYAKYTHYDEHSFYEMMEKVCHRMVDLDPMLFYDKTMSSPASMALTPNREEGEIPLENFDKFCVTARTMNFKFRIAGRNPSAKEPYDVEYIATSLLQELKENMKLMKFRFIYVPAIPIRAIDPGTFKPIVGFKYRAAHSAVYDPKTNSTRNIEDARIFRIPEDLYLEQKQHMAYAKKHGFV
jgi:hypothetical protein